MSLCALRYERQVLVAEIGATGQKKLGSSTVLVVGCGGLGSGVIPILAAAGIGRLVLCDADTVKVSNLSRQTIYKEKDVGQSKVVAAANFVRELNSDVEVRSVSVAIGPQNFDTILQDVDIVVDCADRLSVKIFLNDACVIKGKALVHCVAIGFIGELMVIPEWGKPCYRCFFEGWPVSTELNCAHAGVVGATVGTVGSMAAAEVVKYIVGISETSIGKLHRIDLRSNSFITYECAPNAFCPCCGSERSTDPYDQESYERKRRC